ncbi:hypothetical protein AT728_37655 [Streptomyces silvensis]|uniref:Uncharacterized protein n=1 Tax=Streptomyces silvensis TaxID=1765722 RepID=A0A0W7WR79_9ACTN|nr:hypothetical protein AT728_37655 [Streptomyces silvensis]
MDIEMVGQEIARNMSVLRIHLPDDTRQSVVLDTGVFIPLHLITPPVGSPLPDAEIQPDMPAFDTLEQKAGYISDTRDSVIVAMTRPTGAWWETARAMLRPVTDDERRELDKLNRFRSYVSGRASVIGNRASVAPD